jgi:hypothetical protein
MGEMRLEIGNEATDIGKRLAIEVLQRPRESSTRIESVA